VLIGLGVTIIDLFDVQDLAEGQITLDRMGFFYNIVSILMIGVAVIIILEKDVNQGIEDCSTESIKKQMTTEEKKLKLNAIQSRCFEN
jgi:hypothetical protein